MVERVLNEKELAQKFKFNENSGNGWVENPNVLIFILLSKFILKAKRNLL